ncbi:MAG: glycosyltransferase family 39 protein [Candidatus Eisenbacteria bacterium]|nr:glycosyltransferase family 39 protein [Candidatus Eisenbacteria bacterium]
MRVTRSGRRSIFLLGLVLTVALAVRLLFLTRNGLWFDEAIVLHRCSLPFGEMLRFIRSGDNTPPLHYILMWGYLRLVGGGQTAAEIPSVLASLVGIVYLYRLGRELLGTAEGGLRAAALLAGSTFYLKYSWEIRCYSLLATLSIASAFYALRSWNRPHDRKALLKYVLAASLALNTHYFAALPLLSLNLIAFGRLRPFRRLCAWTAAQGVVLLSMLPWAIGIGTQFNRVASGFWIPPLTIPWFFGQFFPTVSFNFQRFLQPALDPAGAAIRWADVPLPGWIVLAVFSAILLLCLAGLRSRDLRFPAVFALTGLLFPIGLVVIISLTVQPLFLERYFSSFMPFLALGGAVALERTAPRPRAAVLGVLIVLLGLDTISMIRHPHEQAPRKLAAFLDETCEADDRIIFLSPYLYFPVSYYTQGRLDLRIFMTKGGWEPIALEVPPGNVLSVEHGSRATEGADRVFVVSGYYYDSGYEKKVETGWREWLRMEPSAVRRIRHVGPAGTLWLYEKPEPARDDLP